MQYKITLDLEYNGKNVPGSLELVAKAEDEMCKALNGKVWEYKTLRGLENRIKLLLRVGENGLSDKKTREYVEINHPIHGKMMTGQRLPNYPLQFINEGVVEMLIHDINTKGVGRRVIGLNSFYENPRERYKKCKIIIEKSVRGEELNVPEIVERVTKIIYRIQDQNKGKFPSELQLIEALGRDYREDTASLVQEVYYGIKEGEGL